MADLVTRLRNEVTVSSSTVTPLRLAAADEIERLRKIERLYVEDLERQFNETGEGFHDWQDALAAMSSESKEAK